MHLKKLLRYYHTLIQAKPTQLYHQVYYRFRKKIGKKNYKVKPQHVIMLNLQPGIINGNSFFGNGKFCFLNLEKEFEQIDWNFADFGKLWTYNLTYFDYLNQANLEKEQGLQLISDFISKKEELKDAFEPYPISLRGINWIKFLSRSKINNEEINSFLYQDFLRLKDNLEYHLLANHLLENGFSLLFGAYFFQNEKFYAVAKKIIISQLDEQILKDGAHYELSPMYHQIILYRVLDCINLVQNNGWKEEELKIFLKKKAIKMLGWLKSISFHNLDIPKVNDTSSGIAPTTLQLFEYAVELEVPFSSIKLKDSGYRKFENDDFEFLVDVGEIAPSYQPGHSHADTFQILFNFKNKPVLVDTGISTYEKNDRRQLERSTCSHNTVVVDNTNSSQVWSGFRVGKRARVTIFQDEKLHLEASHNGFRSLGITHIRNFSLQNNIFKVTDTIKTNRDDYKAEGHLHFHPNIDVQLFENMLVLDNEVKIEIQDAVNIELSIYAYADAFNKLLSAKKVTYTFKERANLIVEKLQ